MSEAHNAWQIETDQNANGSWWAEGWRNTYGGRLGMKISVEFVQSKAAALVALKRALDDVDAARHARQAAKRRRAKTQEKRPIRKKGERK